MAFDIVKDCNIQHQQVVTNGLAATVATGLLSTLAVTWLLVLVARNALRNRRRPPQEREKIFRTHIDVYFLCLLLGDLIQSLGAMINVRWLAMGRTFCGSTCTAQGVLKEVGENLVAWFTLVITIHTFCAIFFQWIPPRGLRFPSVVIACICTFIAVFIGTNAGLRPYRPGGPEPYYAPAPYYCWISKGFPVQRIVGEYLWLWICAFLSIVLYVPLYFCLRGNIRVDPTHWGRITFHRHRRSRDIAFDIHTSGTTTQREAVKMLGYPVAYVIIVLPMSVGRWLIAAHVENTTTEDTKVSVYTMLILAGVCVFGLSGVINVTLFLLTRPKLLSLNQQRSRRPTSSYPTVVTIQRSVNMQFAYPDSADVEADIKAPRDNMRISSPPGHYVVGRVPSPGSAEWEEYKHGIELPVRDPLGRLMLKQPDMPHR